MSILIVSSVVKQDISSSSARVLKRCAFCSLSVFVREQSFFYTESLQQPMDLLVSSKFVLSQIDVLSFSLDYPCPVPPTAPNTCLF